LPILKSGAQRAFRHRLLVWFDQNQRSLPWRRDRHPYHVWVSEIMLQQTRVSAVIGHYRRFLQRFPTVEALAAAREGDVLAAWSGLGYYRRARSLHAAARQMVARGRFPATAEAWRALPGIGRYTAAAIASIVHDEPAAVVDGNVERVLARLFRRKPGDAWRLAEELLSPARPGDFNQAMMELGATVCLPQSPWCEACPVFLWCRTRGESPRGVSQHRHKKDIAYLLAARPGSVFLVKRAARLAVMPGMWELPQVDNGDLPADRPILSLRHSITTTDYCVAVHAAVAPAPGPAGQWIRRSRLPALPLTGLTRKILCAAAII